MLALVVAATALVGAACSGDPVPLTTPSSAESAAGVDAATPAPIVSAAAGAFGEILVNQAGMSIYGFTDDVDGVSTCFDGCAGAWPPVLVDGPAVPAGLDAAVFSTVARPDGTHQLKAGKWPLYLFAGDTAPGQTTGHLSGDVWFLARPDGTLVDFTAEPADPGVGGDEVAGESVDPAPSQPAPANPALANPADSDLGEILVSGAGLTLYGFTDDAEGVPTCSGGCAEAWPPILVDGAELPAGLDAAVFSVVERSDGTHQLKAGKWPLYLFAGDVAPGMTTGHRSGDVWFVAASDGSLIDFTPDAAEAAAEADEAPDPYAAPAGVAPISTAASAFGSILVDADGHSLYGFANDVDGVSVCVDGCAQAWPPLLVAGADLPAGLDAEVFSVITRADGTHQLKAGKWPLYLFGGDTAPGQTTGHLSGDVWFLAAPDGKLVDFTPPSATGSADAQPAPAPTAAPAQPAPAAPEPTTAPAPAPTATTGYGSSDY